MKLLYSIFFTVFASIFFLNGQDNSKSGAQLMMEGIIQHRKAKEACEAQDYVSAHKFYDEAFNTFLIAKKAFEKDKTNRERAKEQIELIRKEKDACRPLNKNSNTLEIGAKSLRIPGLVFQKSSGTGRIVGHIANMTVSNFSDKEMILCFSNKGACPDKSVHVGMIYISNEKYQDYVIIGPLDFVIPAQSTFIIPVTGICVQPDKEPVPEAVMFSKPETWILQSDPKIQFSLAGVRSQKDNSGPHVANAEEVWPKMPVAKTNGIIVESGKNPQLTAALVFDAIQTIDSTIQILEQKGSYQRSLLENNSANTNILKKLYSAWFYVGVLTGNQYTYEDFENGILVQIESGTPMDQTNRMSVVSETRKFWEQVLLTLQSSGVLKGNL